MITRPEEHLKGWGRELWIVNNEKYCSKILEIKEGKRCSIHFHEIKHETFYILEGEVEMRLYPDGYPGELKVFIMKQGDTVAVPIKLPHQFVGIRDSKILEISTQHFEEDSYRYVKGD